MVANKVCVKTKKMLKPLVGPKATSRILIEIFKKSVEAVQPAKIIPKNVHLSNSHLVVASQTFVLEGPCYIIGFGKAVLGMSLELEKLLGSHLKMGIVTIPQGILKSQPPPPITSKIQFIEGAADNIPDESALSGALQIKSLAERLTETDIVFVLISGGGSALLPLPTPPITLAEKQLLIRTLSRKGADIRELNCVRKRVSALKGGGLALLARPAQLVALILSDIVGDPLDLIASGPTCPNSDPPSAAMGIVAKYGCGGALPASIRRVLAEEPRAGGDFGHVANFVVGNNRVAAEAARLHAETLGLPCAVLSTAVEGRVEDVAQRYADLARDVDAIVGGGGSRRALLATYGGLEGIDLGATFGVIAAGEPTVAVKGAGRGGRSQQLALDVSVRLGKLGLGAVDVAFLSAGTDGADGPTDAAGAIGGRELVDDCRRWGMEPEAYLAENDAYGFYAKYRDGEFLVKTGHTGTNVMDIHIMVFSPLQV